MRIVGKAIAHDSAELHVTGAATYIDDIREPDGTVHVVPGFAKEGTVGKITSLNLSAVRAAEGVLAVFTAEDISGHNDCSPIMGDDPILAKGEIHFRAAHLFANQQGVKDLLANEFYVKPALVPQIPRMISVAAPSPPVVSVLVNVMKVSHLAPQSIRNFVVYKKE